MRKSEAHPSSGAKATVGAAVPRRRAPPVRGEIQWVARERESGSCPGFVADAAVFRVAGILGEREDLMVLHRAARRFMEFVE